MMASREISESERSWHSAIRIRSKGSLWMSGHKVAAAVPGGRAVSVIIYCDEKSACAVVAATLLAYRRDAGY